MDLYQTLIEYVPRWSPLEYGFLVPLLVVAGVAAYGLWRTEKIVLSQAVSGMALLVWLLFVVGITVLTRKSGGSAEWNIRLFWSWKIALAGDWKMLMEVLLNLVLLLPVGVLLPMMLRRPVRWWQGLLVGMALSLAIELGQLVTRRGLFELDDLLHNSVGCMMGCVIVSKVIGKES